MEITNYYEYAPKNENPDRSDLIKMPFRMIISGASGSGKTLLATNIIIKLLYFDKITIVTTTANTFLPTMLEAYFYGIKDKVEKFNKEEQNKNRDDREKKFFSQRKDIFQKKFEFNIIDPTQLPDNMLDTFSADDHNLLIFDDCIDSLIHDKKFKKIIVSIYVRGRHKSISVMFLTQKLSTIPTTVRENSTHIIVFGKATTDIKNTLARIVEGYDYKMWTQIYRNVEKAGDFLFIDLSGKRPHESKVNLNFKEWLDVSDIYE